MHSIKSKISGNIVNPDIVNQSKKELLGQVITSNEYSNTCNVKYIDYDDTIRYQNNVNVNTENPSLVGWFPEPNDLVLIQKHMDTVLILCPYVENHAVTIRNKLAIKHDAYPETSWKTICGYIL